ncbi:MAG: HAD family hydrolase [Patescibacteria group bacterium]|nr:HAD family hydrolase [Patescibacteria group bacterium]
MIKAVLFDIDGVLLDSEESNREFLRRVIGRFGYKAPTREEYRKAFHLNLRDTIRVLTGEQDEKKIEQMWSYGAVLPDYPDDLLRIPEGLSETIKQLKEKYKLGIATNRLKIGVEEFFNFSGLKKYFDTIVFSEDYSRPKPDPECLFLALLRLKVKPEEAVYVGDAETDMLAAEKAGINFILYSQTSLLGSKIWTDDFKKIPKIILSIGRRRR